jgi:hypothetical protein
MSQQSEERNRQKFAEKMRQKSAAARNAKLPVSKKENSAPASTQEGEKKA